MTDPAAPRPSDQSAPSLHVDSDWKAQAEAERARLAEKEAALSARSGAGGPEQLPPAEFRSLVGLLASQAVMGLGTMADQQGGMQQGESLHLDESVIDEDPCGVRGQGSGSDRGEAFGGDHRQPLAHRRRSWCDGVVCEHEMRDVGSAGPTTKTGPNQAVVEHARPRPASIPRDHGHDGSGDGYRRIRCRCCS